MMLVLLHYESKKKACLHSICRRKDKAQLIKWFVLFQSQCGKSIIFTLFEILNGKIVKSISVLFGIEGHAALCRNLGHGYNHTLCN